MTDAPESYETVCFNIVWYAELGMCDGGGIGYWSHTSFSEPFPTENAAWDRLKHHPDVIPDQERRRYRHKNSMGLVRVRRDLVPCAVPQPQEPTPEAVERAAWQPIETAPKDGTAVDLWSSRGFRLPDCEWGAISWEPDEMGWTSSQGHGSVEDGGPYTHWMPLPAAPAPA